MSSASLVVYPGLKKMKIPFIIFSIGLGVLEIVCDIIRSAGVGTLTEIMLLITIIEYIRLINDLKRSANSFFFSWCQFDNYDLGRDLPHYDCWNVHLLSDSVGDDP